MSFPGPRKVPGKARRSSEGSVFDIIEVLGVIEASPPWYSPTKPQPLYEGAHRQAYWDVPVYGEYQDLRANRVVARIVNHQEKKVISDGDELPLGEHS